MTPFCAGPAFDYVLGALLTGLALATWAAHPAPRHRMRLPPGPEGIVLAAATWFVFVPWVLLRAWLGRRGKRPWWM